MPSLPPLPDLEQLRNQAKDLLRAAQAGDAEAVSRLAAVSDRVTLTAAQLSVARSYGSASWPRLKLQVEVRNALDSGDLRQLADLLAHDPELARTDLEHWGDHPLGVTPLGYVAMLRFNTARHRWRTVTGTGTVARLLLAGGAPVNGRPGDPETPLITAASYGDAEVAQVLIDAGADLEARAASDAGGVPGGTALLHACVFGMTDVVDVLVASRASITGIEEAAAAGDVTGWLDVPSAARVRALVMAADHQRLDVIDVLVAAGTPVDEADSFGRHPLRTAAAGGRQQSVARLLALGADPNLPDAKDRRPLELARQGRRTVEDPSDHFQVEAVLTDVTRQ